MSITPISKNGASTPASSKTPPTSESPEILAIPPLNTLDINLFTHLHNKHILKEIQPGGAPNSSEVMTFFKEVLEAFLPQAIGSFKDSLENLQKLLEGKIDSSWTSTKAAQEVASLKLGERRLLETNEGELILFERTGKGTFSLVHFGATPTVEFGFHDKIRCGFATYYHSVDLEELLLSNDLSKVETLWMDELLTGNFAKAFEHLAPKASTPRREGDFRNIDENGTRALWNFFSLCRHELELDDYKYFKFLLNYHTLSQFYEQSKDNLDEPLKASLKDAAENLLLEAGKYLGKNKGILLEFEGRSAYLLGKEILKNVETENAPQESDSISFKWATSKQLKKFSPLPYTLPPKNPSSKQSSYLNSTSWKRYDIRTLKGLRKVYNSENSTLIEAAVHDLIEELDNDDFLNDLDENELNLYLNTLSSCLGEYTLPRTMRSQNMTYGLLAMIYKLSLRQDETLQDYALDITHFKESILDPLNIPFYQEEFETRQKILSYFDQSSVGKKKIFGFHDLILDMKSFPDYTYLMTIYENDPDVKQELDDLFQKQLDTYPIPPRDIPKFKKSFLIDHLCTRSSYLNARKNKTLYHLRKASSLAYQNLQEDKQDACYGRWYEQEDLKFIFNFKTYEARNITRHLKDPSKPLIKNEKQSPFLEMHRAELINPREESLQRVPPFIPSEGKMKVDGLKDPLDLLQVEPPMQIQKVLYHFRKNLSSLKSVEQQHLFHLEFFKCILQEGKETFLLEIALKDPSTQAQLLEFIASGLQHFSDLKTKPDVKTALFFIQLGQKIRRIDPSVDIPEFSPYFDTWLQDPLLSAEAKTLIHLHRVLDYGHLEELDEEECATLLRSWVYYKQNPLSKIFDPFLDKEANKLMLHYAPRFEEILGDEDTRTSLLNQVLETCGLTPLPTPWNSTAKSFFPYLKQTDAKGKEFWGCNLIEGIIANSYGLIGKQDHSLLEKLAPGLFQPSSPINRAGNELYFQDQFFGSIKIVLNGDSLISIERKMGEEWFLFIEPSDPELQSLLPSFFLRNSTHWQAPDGALYIYKSSPDPYAKVTNGIYLANKKGKFSKTIVDKQTLKFSKDKFAPLRAFEPLSELVLVKKKGSLQKLLLPRYSSIGKESLSFSFKEKEIVFDANPHFRLAPTQRTGLLGGKGNYLLLEERQGKKEKLLLSLPLKSKRYVEYDLRPEGPKPLDVEGTLALAYLHFEEGPFSTAHQLLKSLSRSEDFSEVSLELLHLFMEREGASPARSAIALKASLLLSYSQKPTTTPQSGDFFSPLPLLYATYLKELPHIPSEFRLTLDEEKELLFFMSSFIAWNAHPLLAMRAKKFSIPIPNLKFTLKSPRKFFEFFKSKMISYLAPTSFLKPERVYKFTRVNRDVNFPYEYTATKKDIQSLIQTISLDPTVSEGSFAETFGSYYSAIKNAKNLKERKAIRLKIQLTYPDLKGTEHLAFELLSTVILHPHKSPSFPAVGAEEKFWKKLADLRSFNGIKALPRTISMLAKRAFTLLKSIRKSDKASDLEKLNPLETLRTPPVSSPKKSPYAHDLTLKTPTPLNLSTLFDSTFDSTPQQAIPRDLTTTLTLKPEDLSPEEQPYLDVINQESALLLEDLQEGMKINDTKPTFTPKPGKSRKGLATRLRTKIATMSDQLQKEEAALLKKANKRKTLRDKLLLKGNYHSKLTLEDLKNLFILGTNAPFMTANPSLTEEEILELRTDLQQHLVNRLDQQQAKRVLTLLEQKASNQEIGFMLKAQMEYTPNPLYLVFEERANLRLRAKQVKLLEEMTTIDPQSLQFKSLVKQLMMGEGKTAVIAALFLYIAAEGGEGALFSVPRSQMSSVKQNLLSSHKRILGQEIFSIELPRMSEFTTEELQWVLNTLEDARNQEGLLLIEAETLQALQLDFLRYIHHLREYPPYTKEEKQTALKQVNLYQTILQKTKKNYNALFDEIDLTLNTDKEMNFPVGEPQKLHPTYVNLLKELYETLLSDKAVKDSTFQQIVRLQENKQQKMTEEEYEEVKKALAETLLNNHPKWTKHQESFIKFVTGEMTQENCTEEDQTFLEELDTLHSSSEKKREDAECITLAKYLISTILPSTLSRNTGEHYGRNSAHKPGKVTHYLAVGTPAQTEFGNPWEAAALHYQTAASKGIALEQLKAFAEETELAAEHYVEKENVPVDDTSIGKKFKKLTTLKLSEMHDTQAVDKALKHINKDLTKIFTIETASVLSLVSYHETYLSSNSRNLTDQVSTKRGFSGTPWNYPSYEKELAENTSLDKGTGGQIIDVALARVEKHPESLHVVEQASAKTFLETAFARSKRSEKIRGIIDVAGLFKNEKSNETVAREILHFFKDNQEIEYVLFFDRLTPHGAPDHLMCLKKGHKEPIYLGSTRKDELAKKGIHAEHACYYFDQRHTEATDLPQMKNIIHLKTLSPKVQMRADHQARLRARDYMNSQDVEYIILEEDLPLFIGDLPSLMKDDLTGVEAREILECIIKTEMKNEAIKKAKSTEKGFDHKIRHPARRVAIEELLITKDLTRLTEAFTRHEPALMTQVNFNSPYAVFRDLPETVETKVLLQGKIKRPSLKRSQRKEVERELEGVKEEIKRSPWLSKTTIGSTNTMVGTEKEVQQEVQQEIETELETELNKELLFYTGLRGASIYKEKSWTKELVEKRGFPNVSSVKRTPSKDHPKIFRVNELFSQKGLYKKEYSSLFNPHLLISENCAFTVNKLLPFLHMYQKTPDQLLVIAKGDHIEVKILSTADAKFYKKYLAKEKNSLMWLMFADQTSISSHEHVELSKKEKEELNRLLIEVNLLAGNARYLDLQEKEWQSYLKALPDKKVALRYLKLAVEKDPVQKRIFYYSLMNKNG